MLLHGSSGAWVISYDCYGMPVYLDQQHLERAERIEAPEEYVANRKRVMSDAQKKELIKTNMTNPTWYKVYEDAGTSKEHLCEILGTNVIMAHVVRDAWTGKMTVVKKEYLNSSK